MIEVHEMLEGIDPESLPNDPETQALLAATEFAKYNRLHATILRDGHIAEQEMANARTDFAFAVSMMRRDDLIRQLHIVEHEQAVALSNYRRALANFMQMPVMWEGDDS